MIEHHHDVDLFVAALAEGMRRVISQPKCRTPRLDALGTPGIAQ